MVHLRSLTFNILKSLHFTDALKTPTLIHRFQLFNLKTFVLIYSLNTSLNEMLRTLGKFSLDLRVKMQGESVKLGQEPSLSGTVVR